MNNISQSSKQSNTQIQIIPFPIPPLMARTVSDLSIRYHLLPNPILSSLDRTIRALSPGNGFNSSFGSYFLVVNSLSMYSGWPPLPPLPSRVSSSFLRRRASSNAVMSSGVIVMAVGFRRSILFFFSLPFSLLLSVVSGSGTEASFSPSLSGCVRGLQMLELLCSFKLRL
ncbi:hypothetical protein VTN31DRAFT_7352 [Thermomyces dupontii]|uniref:uncharacterized protein n=1 Tax=Talaromyces thermophilus TaxID=28565 RepID=UPI003742C3C7